MIYVQAFITNIAFPKTLKELSRYIYEDGCFDVEKILKNPWEVWTAPRWCKPGDIVFFMHAKTASDTIRALRKLLDAERNFYDYDLFSNWLTRGENLHEKYGGKIFAIGQVAKSPEVYEDDEDFIAHWKSRIYAYINNLWLLPKPVDISEFRSFLKVSRQSSITPVLGNDFVSLKKIIAAKNSSVPNYFCEAEATPLPLAKITKSNWLEVSNIYRREFFLEIQFRKFYVDYFLPILGDIKKFFHECLCKKLGENNSFVDNVILLNKKYLPVEVKLNINTEINLLEQLKKYCDDDYISLTDSKKIFRENIYSRNVLLIDTEKIFLYEDNYETISELVRLDDIKTEHDIFAFREQLIKIMM